ncbi:hypothetical protein OB955_15135 [Halobacteria archaeon AArc-m2/3/4]|uniref:Uncharacterized protein n=1 Tax=Natronoglomus mannanivorans TaxID=2979990 RepID=A0ABT2QGK6_9EURY|nr:hypothetical protein [Halobacteria archaeon AArc-m2/3/4]
MRNLLTWMLGTPAVEEPRVRSLDDEAVERLATQARGETVTVDVLTNEFERSKQPIVSYLDDDERPQYVVRGSSLLITNEDEVDRNYPTRELQVVISDERILFVLGGRKRDEVLTIPHEDLVDVYLDTVNEPRRFLVVDADHNDDEMTFFAKVTLEPAVDELRTAIEYTRRTAGIDD